MKPSTRQRFVAMRFNYPEQALERNILMKEADVDENLAYKLVELARALRRLDKNDLDEVASTRLLVYAARMMSSGMPPLEVCRCCLAEPLTDDPQTVEALMDVARIYFE